MTLIFQEIGPSEPREMLIAFWLDPGILILWSNKPFDHWPFQQQGVKKPAVSPEVTDGGTKKQVSLFRGLWFPKLLLLDTTPTLREGMNQCVDTFTQF